MGTAAPTILERKRYRYRGMEFWPEAGLVHLEDRDSGEYTVLVRREALLRARAINDTVHHYPHASERDEMHRLVSDLIDCVREAKRQGDPSDPEVAMYKAREVKRARRARVLMPDGRPAPADAVFDWPPVAVLSAPVPDLDRAGVHPERPLPDRLIVPNVPDHRNRPAPDFGR